ncbi:MAG: hypothetical protein HBSAPP03_09450 [Phycisphaerae bacterium]|nr:MAG: hypothetical protein HBSAPP03_09450 [Phycisphaerae bacterium]
MMKSLLRRLALGLGAMLLTAGAGVFLVGHELLQTLISFAEENKEHQENVFKAFGGGVVLAVMGAGLLGAAMPRPRLPSDPKAG